MPLHLAVAYRIGDGKLVNALKYLASKKMPDSRKIPAGWPINPQWCLFYRKNKGRAVLRKEPVSRLYKGQQWGVFSDDLVSPTRAMTIRGGTTKVPHGHLDLLSFHCVVGNQSMITNLSPAEYLDTTFSPRRWDIFEMRPDSKNTIFINGVGVVPDSALHKTVFIKRPSADAIRMDATNAFGLMRDGKMADFAGRLIIFVRKKYWIIIDKVKVAHFARIESRMHTFADVKMGKDACCLKRGKEKLSITYASSVPSVLTKAAGAPTTPSSVPATMLRRITKKLHDDVSRPDIG